MKDKVKEVMKDKPDHYNSRSLECIVFVRDMDFNLGSAFKYVWRLGMKDDNEKELVKVFNYIHDSFTHCDPKHPGRRSKYLLSLLESIKNEFNSKVYCLLRDILMVNDGDTLVHHDLVGNREVYTSELLVSITG